VLEICLTGKKLTDKGVAEMATALVEAVEQSWPDGTPCVVLEELQLSNNALTAGCLPDLAKIIRASASHIKDLDLSSNCISIQTQVEADGWRDFLQSFRHVCQLRRLVLSSNPLHGPVPMEILAQTYSQHSQATSGDLGIGPRINGARLAHKTNGQMGKGSIELENTSNLIYGLRSIPYIVFADIGLEDVGALWLSYCIEAHYHPDRLMAPIKVGPIAATIASYKQKTKCDGLIYEPNSSLSIHGWRTLHSAESSRNSHAEEFEKVVASNGSTKTPKSDPDQHEIKTR
jgi:hypothetical protein